MKNLFRNIWEAPGSTISGGIIAAIGALLATDADVPKNLMITLICISAFLSIFSGPNKSGKSSLGRFPCLLLLAGLSCLLSSCGGVSVTGHVPIPERFGGGSIPITIHADK